MKDIALEHTLRMGREYVGLGRHAQAVELIERVLRRGVNSAELHALFGGALMGLGRHAEAEQYFSEATRLKPDYAEAFNDLGNAIRLQGRFSEAIAIYRDAVRLQPGIGMIHQNLGTALAEEGLLAEAEASLSEATRLQPLRAEAFHDLGVVLQRRGKTEQALKNFTHALRLDPALVSARVGLARSHVALGEIAQAISTCEDALRFEPKSHDALVGLGSALQAQGNLEQAAVRYQAALTVKPDSVDATYQLATVRMSQNRLDEASTGFHATLRLKPRHALAANNLGNVLLAQSRPEEAIGCFLRAQELDPDFAGAYSNVLFALNFVTDKSPDTIAEAHRHWGEMRAAPLAQGRSVKGTSVSDRRLRVGYVSGDFRAHSVSLFIEPVLEFHDRRKFEVFCYSDAIAPDEITSRLRALADNWINLTGINDESAAARIRQDGIDVLVDLAGHTGANRLLMFAREPSPIQVTWLGYPNTTGMKAMNYRLTDALADPPGLTERFYSETLARMPDSLWCYRPDGSAPQVNPLPALAKGYVTFGSFNNFAKVTKWTRSLWARLMKGVPGSKLLIVGVPEGEIRARIREEFISQGIDPVRLSLSPRLSRQEFFRYHHDVDIALDPHPFQGGTTTCETLWMGVPVISMAGNAFASRAGVSLLSNVGLGEFVARDAGQYVSIAKHWAESLPRLAALRGGLRSRMAKSPLTDGARFTANLEVLYRRMWRDWCIAAG
jgi:predicted O-linked N-acetylglucosamine transferase (SPINDLY family)